MSKGFTLPELMVSVVIIGILSAIGFSGYQKTVQKERLKSGTEGLAQWLENVRTTAIQQKVPCAVRASGETGTLQLEPYESTAACSSNIPAFNLKEAGNDPNLMLCTWAQSPTTAVPSCSNGAGNLQIIFSPRGTSSTDALMRIKLSGITPDRCIQLVAPLGIVRSGRVVDGSCNWSTNG